MAHYVIDVFNQSRQKSAPNESGNERKPRVRLINDFARGDTDKKKK